MNGLAMGGIYILVALGLTLVFSIMRILQFAHGEVYMLGAYVVYYLSVHAGLNFFLAFPISMVTVGIFGLFLERVFFRHFQGQFIPTLIVALGLMLILQTSAMLAFGLTERAIPNYAPGTFEVLGAAVFKDRLLAAVFGLGLAFLLYLFLKRFKYGRAMTAVAQSREGAALQGINPNLMSALGMAIGSALAAAGGAFAGALFPVVPAMGSTALFNGLVIIVLGGMGSLLGVVVGGMMIGLINTLVPIFIGPTAAVAVPLVLIIIILIIRPQGFFGHEF